MSNLHSAITLVLVLAAIIVPHALAVWFSVDSEKEHEEEYVPDGR